jgi:hypothetical protein
MFTANLEAFTAENFFCPEINIFLEKVLLYEKLSDILTLG